MAEMGIDAPSAGEGTPSPPPEAFAEDGAARILIVRLGGAADVVLALPVLHALREAYPDSGLGWLVDGSSAALLEGHPELTRLHVVPEGEWRKLGWWKRRRRRRELRETLRSQGYSVVIDLESSPRSARLCRATGARVRIGYAPPAGRELSSRYHTHRIRPGPKYRHVVERNMSLLVPLGVSRPLGVSGVEPSVALPYVYPDLSDLTAEFTDGERPVVLHPGAEWPSSRWPVEHFAELARRVVAELDTPVVVTAFGDDDRPRAQAVADEARRSVSAAFRGGVLASPATGLREFAAFVREAALFVGGDTAAMHVAWTSGAPTVAIFGPTSGTGRDPLGPRSRSIDAGLGCAGCGRPRCPDAAHACMRGVRPEAVFELVREVL